MLLLNEQRIKYPPPHVTFLYFRMDHLTSHRAAQGINYINTTQPNQIAKDPAQEIFSKINQLFGNNDDYHVQTSNKLVNDWDPNYWYKAFPALFPFHRGGFDEAHENSAISLEAYIQYLLQLSTGRFLDYDFVCIAYDIISRKQQARGCLVHSLQQPKRQQAGSTSQDNGTAFSKITKQDLALAASYHESVTRARRIGKPTPTPPANLSNTARDFVKSCTLSSAFSKHTYEYASQARQKAYAMHHQFGKPTWWFTMTPEDLTSLLIWRLAGGTGATSSLPPRAKRVKILNDNPGAAALSFQKVMDTVIRVLLGWDENRNAPFKKGGLLGIVKAFSYCVEEQGRKALHFHMLVWCVGDESMMTKALDWYNALEDSMLHEDKVREVNAKFEKMRTTIDNIVSTKLYLPTPTSAEENVTVCKKVVLFQKTLPTAIY